MLDPFLQAILGDMNMLRQTGETEEFRRAPVDHLLMASDFVIGESPSAFHAFRLHGAVVHELLLNESTAEDLAVVSGYMAAEVFGNNAFNFFAADDFAELEAVACSNGKTDVVEFDFVVAVSVSEVEVCDCVFAVFQMLEEYGSVAAANHHRRTSFFILVDGDEFLVLEQFKVEVILPREAKALEHENVRVTVI